MKMLRCISMLLAVFMAVVSISACGTKTVKIKYNTDQNVPTIQSGIVAENDKLTLNWNDEAKSVSFKDKTTGKIWSNIPIDVIEEGRTSANLNSTINVELYKENTFTNVEVKGYSAAFENGRISSEQIENGIKVTYYLDEYKVSVPVEYVLRDNSLLASISSKDIVENDEYRIISVSVAPYMASAKNETKGAYLLVPSGSGALMYAAETVEGNKEFSCDVYGSDYAELKTISSANIPKAYLPVFGAKDGDYAICGIIEKGAESVRINAESGNSRTNYSNIYPTYYLRSTDRIETDGNDASSMDSLIKSEVIADSSISIAYYPLSGDDADYNGMAQIYREYLVKDNDIKNAASGNGNYAVTFYGGVEHTKTVLGIPKKQLDCMTEFSQAKKILEKLIGQSGTPSDVRLYGYGDRGVSAGKIAGGYSFDSVYGSMKDFSSLEKFCESEKISLYSDFDTVRFSKSGSGFSLISNSAKSATLRSVDNFSKKIPLGDYNTDYSYRLLKRDLLSVATEKLIKFADKKGISGISLSALSNIAYSDHANAKTAVKSGIAEDVKKQILSIKNAGHKIAVDNANIYAAVVADTIYNTPIDNGGYNILDESIPFYQIALSGIADMYCPSVNLADNVDKQIMRCAAYGIKPEFSLIYFFDTVNMEIGAGQFNGMLYSDNLDSIDESVKKLNSLFSKIGNSSILKYEIVNDNIGKTVYENGVTVISNHSSNEVNYSGKTIEPYGFSLMEKGE